MAQAALPAVPEAAEVMTKHLGHEPPVTIEPGDRVIIDGRRAVVERLRVIDGEIQAYCLTSPTGFNDRGEGVWIVVYPPPDPNLTWPQALGAAGIVACLTFLIMIAGLALVSLL